MNAKDLFIKHCEIGEEEIETSWMDLEQFTLALTEYKSIIEPEIRMEQDLINQKAWLEKQDRILAEYKVEIHKLIDETIRNLTESEYTSVYDENKSHCRFGINILTELKQKLEEK